MVAPTDRLAFAPAEVAEMLGLHERTVREYCARGEIRATKAGDRWLIPRAEVARLAGDDLAPHESGMNEEREVQRLRRELQDLRDEVNRRVGRLLDEG